MNDHGDDARISLPALLRAARRVFGHSMREELVHAGHDDIPGNGLFVIGAMARSGAPLSRIIGHLGGSKQATGQLIDTLVRRGYLQRTVDAEDRRRLRIDLSERGRSAAAIIADVSERIETKLVQRIGAESVARTRATLAALIGIGRGDVDALPGNRAAGDEDGESATARTGNHVEASVTSESPNSGAVIYAKALSRLAAFYVAVASLEEVAREPDFVTLQRERFQLVIVAVPEKIAASIPVAEPPQRRENVAIKPVFFVASIDIARRVAADLGGELNPSDRQWRFGDWQVCDGRDPEGNVFQLRAPLTHFHGESR